MALDNERLMLGCSLTKLRMTETEKYVRRYLKDALEAVQHSAIANVSDGLGLFEKALIYHYTWDGYRSINRSLRRSNGSKGTKAAKLLEQSLQKLPDWQGMVYRTADLTEKQLARYANGLVTGVPIVEPAFISTSRAEDITRDYPNWNIQFRLFVTTGKSIEDCSRLGSTSQANEQEIILTPGKSFLVREVTNVGSHALIILREV